MIPSVVKSKAKYWKRKFLVAEEAETIEPSLEGGRHELEEAVEMHEDSTEWAFKDTDRGPT